MSFLCKEIDYNVDGLIYLVFFIFISYLGKYKYKKLFLEKKAQKEQSLLTYRQFLETTYIKFVEQKMPLLLPTYKDYIKISVPDKEFYKNEVEQKKRMALPTYETRNILIGYKEILEGEKMQNVIDEFLEKNYINYNEFLEQKLSLPTYAQYFETKNKYLSYNQFIRQKLPLVYDEYVHQRFLDHQCRKFNPESEYENMLKANSELESELESEYVESELESEYVESEIESELESEN